MPEETAALNTWAIVELFGHKKLAGKLTEQTFGTAALFRLDVPETAQAGEGELTKPYTKLIGVSSIYAITPCTEEVARAAAQRLERYNDPIPVDLPQLRQLAATTTPASPAELTEPEEEGEDLPWQ